MAHARADNPYTRGLAEFASGLRYERIPQEVRAQDGTRLEQTVESPRSSEASFASESDVVAKFTKLAAHAVPTPVAERIVDLVVHLDAYRIAPISCGLSRSCRGVAAVDSTVSIGGCGR